MEDRNETNKRFLKCQTRIRLIRELQQSRVTERDEMSDFDLVVPVAPCRSDI